MSLDSSIHCHFITPYISTDPNAAVYTVVAAVMGRRCMSRERWRREGEWSGPGRAREDKDARGKGGLFILAC